MIVHLKLDRIRATFYGPGPYWLVRGPDTIYLGHCDTPEILLVAIRNATVILQIQGPAGAGWITQPDQLPD